MMRKILLCFVVGAFASSAYAADKPLPVTITNSSVPVSVINSPANTNVTVTNLPGNPVVVKDAFARTPVTLDLFQDQQSYTVPDGYRLVVETASATVQCPVNTTQANVTFASVGTIVHIPALMPVFFGEDFSSVVNLGGTLSARVAFEPGVTISAVNGRCARQPTRGRVVLMGYLLSVDSPSLAP